jgi:glycogen operon protein
VQATVVSRLAATLPLLALALAACAAPADDPDDVTDPFDRGPSLGARLHDNGDLEVRVHAPRATRVEVEVFAEALGAGAALRVAMDGGEADRFRAVIAAADLKAADLDAPYLYGLRAFGPNWEHDPGWSPGSELGLFAEVDGDGNRMNPNKLLIDPYALELSHDPINAANQDFAPFLGDAERRALDSAPVAPKSVVIDLPEPITSHPRRRLADDVIYEVHLRGLTAADPSVPEAERGTYAGAARKAGYLAQLGVTAVEFLPLHETFNDQNDLTPDASGDNYWGYSSLSYFAPDRRFAADKSPGGPTREFREMVEAFHAAGIKVFVDVVFNHTAEGGGQTYFSWRGLDNAGFYQLADDPAGYVNSNGVGPNFNTAGPLGAELIIESLRYWHEILGVDGFRFDLASVVANRCERGCYEFDPAGVVREIAGELARDETGAGVDLIAEPWGAIAPAYQLGRFPDGWAEWNDRYRDAVRRDLNRLDSEPQTLREVAARLRGSTDIFGSRGFAASINFVTAHDGMTLNDLFSYDERRNDQPWPYGPSDGGRADELQSSHGGDRGRQKSAARTALAMLALSAGTPMITGGDEYLRAQRGNNNAYNLDSPGIWLSWEGPERDEEFVEFTAAALRFRRDHPALRSGGVAAELVDDLGLPATQSYLDATDRHFLGLRLSGAAISDPAAAIAVGYNGWTDTLLFTPPPPPGQTAWHLVADTGPDGAGFGHWRADDDAEAAPAPIAVAPHSLVVLIAR